MPVYLAALEVERVIEHAEGQVHKHVKTKGHERDPKNEGRELVVVGDEQEVGKQVVAQHHHHRPDTCDIFEGECNRGVCVSNSKACDPTTHRPALRVKPRAHGIARR